uniref:Uncharacterized protein n=1 Tax=Ditylenchus dipsaci TaxID=166011 RepID=A0A915EN84_9BILA
MFYAMVWSPADSGYLKDAGKWLEVTNKFNEEETTNLGDQFKELWHSLTTYHNKVKNNSKNLSGAGAEECATAVKWAHFESMGFLMDKQHQEERYSNLSQSIMEADGSEVN